MALVSCAECKHQLSTSAASCPACGAPRHVAIPAAPLADPRRPVDQGQRGVYRPEPFSSAPAQSGSPIAYLVVAGTLVIAGLGLYAHFNPKERTTRGGWDDKAHWTTFCIDEKSARESEFEHLMMASLYDEAWRLAFDCVGSDESFYAPLRNKAAIAGNMKKLSTLPPEQWEERLRVIEELSELAPDLAKPYVKELKPLQDRLASEQSVRARASINRPVDPRLGMPRIAAENLSWGHPSTINTDSTVGGVSEQWVYPGKGYLYFRNGILMTIQERP